MTTIAFADAIERGTVVEQSGYHQPGGLAPCGCTRTTPKGAYRDVTAELDGRTLHYYHQSPVVVREGARYRVDHYGYTTPTTKERINRYIPGGFRVYQRDFEWFVETPDGDTLDFERGMTLEVR